MRFRLLVPLLALLLSPAGFSDTMSSGHGRNRQPSSVDLAWVARGELAQGNLHAAGRTLDELCGRSVGQDAYTNAVVAEALAQGAVRVSTRDIDAGRRYAGAAERRLAPLAAWLKDYPSTIQVHGSSEPAWVHGQAGAVAEAILAWCELQQVDPSSGRKQLVSKFAKGLLKLSHPAPDRYPFRAHVSLTTDGPAYAPNPRGGMVPGELWVTRRARQAQALVAAYRLLEDPDLLAAAQREGLGMLAHVVMSGKLVRGFAPHPEPGGDLRDASVLVDGFTSLYSATERRPYAVLAGLAAAWRDSIHPRSAAEKAAAVLIREAIKGIPAEVYRRAHEVEPPCSYEVMDAENGRSVHKAFEVSPIHYPSGAAGAVVTVGRDNMFWMRFDVPREGDYYFYLIFLKNKVSAALTSVRMRIDGDNIFQVPLGGASGRPFMAMDLVDGPRPMRQGPHSFGIRFSGLLMTRPAVLDAVVVQPVVEQRILRLPNGHALLVLKSLSPKPARCLYDEVQPWPPLSISAVDGDGHRAKVTYTRDPRRNKRYLMVPPAGMVLVEWKPDGPLEQ